MSIELYSLELLIIPFLEYLMKWVYWARKKGGKMKYIGKVDTIEE